MYIKEEQQQYIITNSTEDGAPACMPAEVILVLQGGGALGAYQAGVYEALYEANLEPDWIIGTSIGAINGAIIAGNPRESRLQKMNAFWDMLEQEHNLPSSQFDWMATLSKMISNFFTLTQGVSGFFRPNPLAVLGPYAKLGSENASYYRTYPLEKTLNELIDFDYLNKDAIRLTLSAVEILSGQLNYFDTRHLDIEAKHIMASGALPPGFPAIHIEDKIYWDGGLYSNTPIEAIFAEDQRRNSLIFSVNLWNSIGKEPETILDVMERQKDIQYASRLNNYICHQQQLQKLRQIILRLVDKMPPELQRDKSIRQLETYGCSRTMHVVQLLAPHLPSEDYLKDIDFSAEGISIRRKAGYEDTMWALKHRPWQKPIDKFDSVILHEVAELKEKQQDIATSSALSPAEEVESRYVCNPKAISCSEPEIS